MLVRDRSCNLKFYKWLFQTVLVDFIKLQRKVNNLPEDAQAFLQLDGEAKQIEAFRLDEIAEYMEKNNVTIGKPPGSTTQTTQACDAGNCIKATKTVLGSTKDKDVKHRSSTVSIIRKILVAVNEEFGGKSSKKQMTSLHMGSASKGILRIQLALMRSINSTVIIHSFKKTGVWDYDLKPPGFNINTIFGNAKDYCGECLTPDDIVKITAALPALVNELREKGELFETTFDNYHIRKNINADQMAKNDLHISRRRFCFLTNPAFLVRAHDKDVAATAKKASAASKKRKLKIVDAAGTQNVSKVAKAAEPSIPLSDTPVISYKCMNPSCGVVSHDGEADNGWLECECCTPTCWTCGNCSKFMSKHEKVI